MILQCLSFGMIRNRTVSLFVPSDVIFIRTIELEDHFSISLGSIPDHKARMKKIDQKRICVNLILANKTDILEIFRIFEIFRSTYCTEKCFETCKKSG